MSDRRYDLLGVDAFYAKVWCTNIDIALITGKQQCARIQISQQRLRSGFMTHAALSQLEVKVPSGMPEYIQILW